MSVTVVLGAQWGDEGKGKLVDILGAEADVCARCAGGNNAGHTIVVPIGPEHIEKKFAFHLLPSGLVNPSCVGLIGSGVVVHIPSFFEELDALQSQGLDCTGRLFISDRAHLVFDFHQIVDGLKEVELGGSRHATSPLFSRIRSSHFAFPFSGTLAALTSSISSVARNSIPHRRSGSTSGVRSQSDSDTFGHKRSKSTPIAPTSSPSQSSTNAGIGVRTLPINSIGTTKKGIGPAYSGKASRSGLRVHHLFNQESFAAKFRKVVEGRFKRYGHFEYDTEKEILRYKELAERLRPYVIDSLTFLHTQLAQGRRVLVEGANALMLDLDFGTYPFVTSSSTSIGGVCTGLGIPPRLIGKTIGVVKAYTTRVGGGPFPTEQLNDIGVHLQEVGAEFGVTTGRRRRCGWLDLVVLKHSCLINGYTSLNLTKLDVLDDLAEIQVAIGYEVDGNELLGFPADLDVLSRVKVQYETLPGWKTSIANCTKYEELPENCKKYIEYIEKSLGVGIEWIGVGPARHSMIKKAV